MIEMTQQGEITLLQMAHGKANPLDVEFCEALTARLTTLRSAPTRAVVLIGTGQIFSAGVDLLRLLDEDATYLQAFLPALITMFETVFFHPQPVVERLQAARAGTDQAIQHLWTMPETRAAIRHYVSRTFKPSN